MKLLGYLILLKALFLSCYLFDGNTKDYIDHLVEKDD